MTRIFLGVMLENDAVVGVIDSQFTAENAEVAESGNSFTILFKPCFNIRIN
jgi:hypothetical protein